MILSLLGGDTPPNNTQQKTINVDSLFAKNISELKSIVNDSTVHILKDRNLIDFMWMISLIGDKNLIVPHKVIQIDKKTIAEIEQWYIDNKQYITPRNIEKAYNLMYPPPLVFESYETWMEWIDKQCDSLEIRGSKSGFNF